MDDPDNDWWYEPPEPLPRDDFWERADYEYDRAGDR